MKALGRWATRKVHGNSRSRDGYLLTKRHYLDDDQEWRLGLCYVGLVFSFLGIAAISLYVNIAFAHLRTVVSGRSTIRLGHWSDLSADMKLLIPLLLLLILSAVFWVMRYIAVVRPEIEAQPRSEIED